MQLSGAKGGFSEVERNLDAEYSLKRFSNMTNDSFLCWKLTKSKIWQSAAKIQSGFKRFMSHILCFFSFFNSVDFNYLSSSTAFLLLMVLFLCTNSMEVFKITIQEALIWLQSKFYKTEFWLKSGCDLNKISQMWVNDVLIHANLIKKSFKGI